MNLRRSIVFVSLLIPLLVGCNDNASERVLRIATYNVNYANQRSDLILDAITAAKPDVICFQETTQQLESVLRNELSKSHPYFYAAGHKGQFAAERFAFASRFELQNLKYTEPTTGLFGFYSTDANLSGRKVHIVNVHLTPFIISRDSGLTKAVSALSETEIKHQEEINTIITSITPNQPTIIIGDFNSASTFQAPQRLVDAGFVDAYASVTSEPDNHPTWTWPTRPVPLSMRIDYIFHSPHFKSKDSIIIQREGSDHSMVVASLKLN